MKKDLVEKAAEMGMTEYEYEQWRTERRIKTAQKVAVVGLVILVVLTMIWRTTPMSEYADDPAYRGNAFVCGGRNDTAGPGPQQLIDPQQIEELNY